MLKDILVHLDGTDEDAVRLSYAETIATDFGAHLTGLLTNELPQPVYPIDGAIYVPPPTDTADAEAAARGDAVAAKLKERFAAIATPNALVRIDATPDQMGERLAGWARAADLFIASRPMDPELPNLWRNAFTRVLFSGGRAVLAVPRKKPMPGPIGKAMITWNGSRQAARALGEALPLLLKAREIALVLVDPPLRPAGTEQRPGDEVIRHLSRYGLTATLFRVSSSDKRVSDAILAEAKRNGAELIVMGGYGGSSLLQWVLGGVSEEMLTRSPVPLLLAH